MAAKRDEDIAAGAAVEGQGEVKIPEGVMKPRYRTDGSQDMTPSVASGEPVNAMGCKVDESETKIPKGTMKPTAISSAGIAAGELVDASGNKAAEHDAKIPEGIMKPGSVS